MRDGQSHSESTLSELGIELDVELDELVEYSYLYDFYGALLKEKHRKIFEDYILNNMSLGEIAKENQITRQGVYDAVRRCKGTLKEYEAKLHLVDKFRLIERKLHEIEQIAEDSGGETGVRIKVLAEEIYDVI